MGFIDRAEAGRQLARLVTGLLDERPVVLAVARGGIEVGQEVAQALRAPLEVMAVRKLVSPSDPQRTLGAVTEGGLVIREEGGRRSASAATGDDNAPLSTPQWAQLVERERAEVERRVQRFRRGRPLPRLETRTAVVVDDGVATGVTARAAIALTRQLSPARLALAVPVGSLDVIGDLRAAVDELFCVETRLALWAVGLSYQNYAAVDDEEVIERLGQAGERP